MPAGHFVGIDAERSEHASWKRSSRPTKTRVGTFGLLLNWQGDVNTASGCGTVSLDAVPRHGRCSPARPARYVSRISEAYFAR